MRVAVLAERAAGERRVALVPDTVRRLVAAGVEVAVESGAGTRADVPDADYADAGAHVAADWPAALAGAAVLLAVAPPSPAEAAAFPAGLAYVGFLQPAAVPDTVTALARQRVDAYSLDLLPRISRAQSMDALSSQATVAGYRGVLLAAERLPRFFPLLMTAAGTVPPARVLVLGAGVAGLQAIATARRLGAKVEAHDVRPAAAEEVRSLGATFVELGLEGQEGAGGYARVQSEEFLARQRTLVGERVAVADVVVTTAAVPGKRAPLLVTADMVDRMRPGSVVVDLAADGGGNCEVTVAGEEVRRGGAVVLGVSNPASGMPGHASLLYSRNVSALLLHLVRDGRFDPDHDDEIVAGTCVTRAGEVVHPQARSLLGGAA